MASIQQVRATTELNSSSAKILSHCNQGVTLFDDSSELQNKEQEVINHLRKKLASVVVTQRFDTSRTYPDRPKILLLGDSHLRNMVKFTKTCFAEEYIVQCFFKPNGTLENVVEDIYNLTKDFDDKDYVILMAGTNDVLNGTAIKEKILTKVADSVANTTLIGLSVPYIKNMPEHNETIAYINFKLFNFINMIKGKQSAYFLDINRILTDDDKNPLGVHLQMSGKYKILEYLGKNLNVMCDTFVDQLLCP